MRRCLLKSTAAHAEAADFLKEAAEALIADNRGVAAGLLREADLPSIREHIVRLVGKMTPEVHRSIQRPRTIPPDQRHPHRMPPPSVEWQIYKRDGWRCRFCDMKVISRKARSALIQQFPAECRWTAPEYDRHPALYALASSLDHVLPHSRGGINCEENFVTACYGCQFGRGQWLLEEVELTDPRNRPPIVDEWDGLYGLEGFQ